MAKPPNILVNFERNQRGLRSSFIGGGAWREQRNQVELLLLVLLLLFLLRRPVLVDAFVQRYQWVQEAAVVVLVLEVVLVDPLGFGGCWTLKKNCFQFFKLDTRCLLEPRLPPFASRPLFSSFLWWKQSLRNRILTIYIEYFQGSHNQMCLCVYVYIYRVNITNTYIFGKLPIHIY